MLSSFFIIFMTKIKYFLKIFKHIDIEDKQKGAIIYIINLGNYEIDDIVKIQIYYTEKYYRIAICKITNKYIRNNKVYYFVREINGCYIGTNLKEDRFI